MTTSTRLAIAPDVLRGAAADLIRASLEDDAEMAVIVVNELTEAEARDVLRCLTYAMAKALFRTPRSRAETLALLEDGWPAFEDRHRDNDV